jgi:hypothetical protein
MTDQHRKELLIMSVLWGGPSLEDALAKYESDPTPTKKKKSVSKKLKSGLQKASSLITGGSFSKEPDAQERPSSASVSRHSEARHSEIRSRAHTISEASAGGFVVEDEHYTVEMAAQDMVAGAKAAEAAKAAHNAAITPRNLSARGRSKSAASKLWGTGGVIENINPLMNNSDNGESKYNNESKSNDDYESKEDSKEEESKTPTKKERRVSTADVRTMLRGSIGSSQACSGRRSTRSSNGDFRHSQASEERKDSIGGGGGYDRSQYSAPSKRKSSRRVSSADVAALLRGSIHTN